MTGLSCSSWQQEERWCKSEWEDWGPWGWLDHEALAHQRQAMFLYIQTGTGSSTPHQPTPKTVKCLSCLTEKEREKLILKLILIIVLQIYIFFVSSILRNRTFLEACRPRMNHLWKTWHFSSNTQKGKNVEIVWKPVPLSSPTEQQPTTQITKKNNLQFSSRWRAQWLLIYMHLTVAFCEHN